MPPPISFAPLLAQDFSVVQLQWQVQISTLMEECI
jgi:hypothetical protein